MSVKAKGRIKRKILYIKKEKKEGGPGIREKGGVEETERKAIGRG